MLEPKVPVWRWTPVRAGAGKITIDVEHDSVDKEAGKRIECPMLLLLAQGGPLDTFYGKDGGSGNLAAMGSHAHGQAMKAGHFFPEENPDDTAALIKQFLAA